ncbi:RhuM family protein [Streptomyces sp. SL13]|uniref:RhuM family protein n=1 Tax=Streptantibioticus silvisoli TaxID=2705255 RepID=A0AA90GU18_9ACTN|nr:RhuM family protein [Streptantibioticus silvisoli]MDI5968058.1 RhuM family protein [Streptantibioticus silvisoli]
MTSDAVFNGVLVSGGNLSDNASPVSYLATDTGTASLTRWGGPFGQRLKAVSNSLCTTVGACQALAQATLRDALAPNIAATIGVVPNPALDAGDVVRVIHSGDAQLFFATMQNRLYLHVVGLTARQIIAARPLATWPGREEGKPEPGAKAACRKVAKNYLTPRELVRLNRFVSMLCLRAEAIADDGLHLTLLQWEMLVGREIEHDGGPFLLAG